MKNIIDYFKENDIFFTFKYYGIQDFGSGWDIKAIIDNQSVFMTLYDTFPLEKIESKEEYFVYLTTDKIIKLEELIPNIVDENNKEVVQQVVDNAESVMAKISNGETIKFINKSYFELFDEELYVYDVPFLTLDLITKYISGIKTDVIDFLICSHSHMVISHFDEFENWFENNSEYIKKLFPSNKLSYYDTIHFDSVLDIWEHILNKKKTNLNKHIEEIIPDIYSDVEALAKNATSESIIRVDSTIREFNSFLIAIKSPLANRFSKYIDLSKSLMEQHLKTSGQVYKYEIPVQEMVNLWKEETVWEKRLLSSTHVKENKLGCIEYTSRLSLIESNSHPFLDFVKTNIATNESFTYSYQQSLAIQMNVQSAMFHYIITDSDLLTDYFNIALSAVNYISEQMGDEWLVDDCSFLFDNISLLSGSIKVDESVVNVFCYSSSMFICSQIEKLLRLFYKYLLKDVCYVPVEKATLGNLLSENNEPLRNIFGKKHIENLAYFLVHVQPNYVGHNLRNSLAHWNGLSKDNMTVSLVARLLYLFTDVLNTIFWYFIINNGSIEGEPGNDQI